MIHTCCRFFCLIVVAVLVASPAFAAHGDAGAAGGGKNKAAPQVDESNQAKPVRIGTAGKSTINRQDNAAARIGKTTELKTSENRGDDTQFDLRQKALDRSSKP